MLTPPSASAKIAKNARPTYSLWLLPHRLGGWHNVCPWSTPECRASCLNTAGRGGMSCVEAGRRKRTAYAFGYPLHFAYQLEREIRAAVKRHGEIGMRLNVLSDLRWERTHPWLFDIEGVHYYDYTKAPIERLTEAARVGYHLTKSASERHGPEQIGEWVRAGHNVTVVVDTPARLSHRGGFTCPPTPLPDTWAGLPAIDGDVTDDRTTDPKGVVVLLRAKGKARKAKGSIDGFVKPTYI